MASTVSLVCIALLVVACHGASKRDLTEAAAGLLMLGVRGEIAMLRGELFPISLLPGGKQLIAPVTSLLDKMDAIAKSTDTTSSEKITNLVNMLTGSVDNLPTDDKLKPIVTELKDFLQELGGKLNVV